MSRTQQLSQRIHDWFSAHVDEPQSLELQEEIKSLEASFSLFVQRAWPIIEGSKPFIDGWHIQAIAAHLEALYHGQIKKLMIQVPPRTSKTSLVSILFPAWVWTLNPEIKFIYASYAHRISLEHSRICRLLIESPWFQERWGSRVTLSSAQAAKGHFTNTAGGHRIATSAGGATTALGGDILVLDDINNAKDGESEAKRNSTNDWIARVWSSRLNPGGLQAQISVQQRIHEMDASGFILSREDASEWTTLVLPMEFEIERRAKTIVLASTAPEPWSDPRTKNGDLLWPEAIDLNKVQSLRKQLLPIHYAQQYQQRPAPKEGHIIKVEWFKQWKKPRPPQLKMTLQSVDTAFETKDSSCYSAISTWGLFQEENAKIPSLILLSLWRGKVEYPDLRALCIKIFENYLDDGSVNVSPDSKHQVDLMIIEAKANGLSLVQDLRRGGIRATAFNPNKFGDKNQRVSLASSYIKDGLIYLPMLGPDYKKFRSTAQTLVNECIYFPNGRTRDCVDTLSQVILYASSQQLLRHKEDPFEKPTPAQPFKNPYGIEAIEDEYR